jgi:hypothetical protein
MTNTGATGANTKEDAMNSLLALLIEAQKAPEALKQKMAQRDQHAALLAVFVAATQKTERRAS